MATNGNNPQIDALEATLRQVQAVQPAIPPEVGHNIMSLMAALSERCRNMADTMVTSADDDRKEAYDFSNHLLDLARKWGNALLVRKRRELAEIEQFLGKVGKQD
jgi:hypothetical protein